MVVADYFREKKCSLYRFVEYTGPFFTSKPHPFPSFTVVSPTYHWNSNSSFRDNCTYTYNYNRSYSYSYNCNYN